MPRSFKHAEQKLAAARYFRQRLDETEQEHAAFVYNFEAFLVAWRSISEVFRNTDLADPTIKPAVSTWMKSWLEARKLTDTLFEPIAERRNLTVHHEMTKVQTTIHVEMKESVLMTESFSIVSRNLQGNVIQEEHSAPETNVIHESFGQEEPAKVTLRHVLVEPEFKGLEVRAVCDHALTISEDFLRDAASQFP